MEQKKEWATPVLESLSIGQTETCRLVLTNEDPLNPEYIWYCDHAS